MFRAPIPTVPMGETGPIGQAPPGGVMRQQDSNVSLPPWSRTKIPAGFPKRPSAPMPPPPPPDPYAAKRMRDQATGDAIRADRMRKMHEGIDPRKTAAPPSIQPPRPPMDPQREMDPRREMQRRALDGMTL